MPVIAPARGLLGRLRFGGAGEMAILADRIDLGGDLLSALEARALWARYGL